MNFTRTTHYKKNGVTYQLVTDRFDNFVSERALEPDEVPKAVISETLDDFLLEASAEDTMYVAFVEVIKPLLQEGVTPKKVWDIFTNYESAVMSRSLYKLHSGQEDNVSDPRRAAYLTAGQHGLRGTLLPQNTEFLAGVKKAQEHVSKSEHPTTNEQYTRYHTAVFQQGECHPDLPGCAEVVESYKKEMNALEEGCAQCRRQSVRTKYEKLIRKKLGI
jgi:hypothetical protein